MTMTRRRRRIPASEAKPGQVIIRCDSCGQEGVRDVEICMTCVGIGAYVDLCCACRMDALEQVNKRAEELRGDWRWGYNESQS